MSTLVHDEKGVPARYGYTIFEKILTLPGPEELPYGDDGIVYVVCDKRNLEAHFVSTEKEAALDVWAGREGVVVKRVQYVREREESPITPTVFTIDGKPIPKIT
ncbi:MAG: hypothetical protein Q9168_008260 [Polycauliona sp. 1 TL-2023]